MEAANESVTGKRDEGGGVQQTGGGKEVAGGSDGTPCTSNRVLSGRHEFSHQCVVPHSYILGPQHSLFDLTPTLPDILLDLLSTVC